MPHAVSSLTMVIDSNALSSWTSIRRRYSSRFSPQNVRNLFGMKSLLLTSSFLSCCYYYYKLLRMLPWLHVIRVSQCPRIEQARTKRIGAAGIMADRIERPLCITRFEMSNTSYASGRLRLLLLSKPSCLTGVLLISGDFTLLRAVMGSCARFSELEIGPLNRIHSVILDTSG